MPTAPTPKAGKHGMEWSPTVPILVGGLTAIAAGATTQYLNLPTHKCGGFQTVPCGTSRGPFRPRVAACIAPTPGAPEPHLPYPLPSPPGLWKHQDAVQFGVLTEKTACLSTPGLPVRLSRLAREGGAIHPVQPTYPVRQQ